MKDDQEEPPILLKKRLTLLGKILGPLVQFTLKSLFTEQSLVYPILLTPFVYKTFLKDTCLGSWFCLVNVFGLEYIQGGLSMGYIPRKDLLKQIILKSVC